MKVIQPNRFSGGGNDVTSSGTETRVHWNVANGAEVTAGILHKNNSLIEL